MVRAGQTIRIGMKIAGKPMPHIKWSKSEGQMNDLVLTDVVNNRAMLMIESASVLDTGRYEFVLESSSGQKEGGINVRVMDAPSEPQNVTAGNVTKDEVKLTWNAPLNDGCANITHYIVEKRTASKKSYTSVSDCCERESIVIKGLITGESYFFRITAVNKYGNSRGGINAEPIIIASKPDQPISIEVVEMTKNTGTISWTKSNSDGGAPITSYIVEMAKSVVGAETWVKQGSTNKMTFTCRDLTEKASYVFRVRAVNAIGESEPTETRLSAVAVDEIIAPQLETKMLYMSSYTVKADEDVCLDLPVIGKPTPIVKWQTAEGTWRETQRCNTELIKTDDKCFTRLNIKNCQRSDANNFIVTLKNSAGEKQTKIRFIVLDRPSAPVGPAVFSETTPESTVLSWSMPTEDGGAQVNNYVVHKRESESDIWTEVAGTVVRSSLKIKNLAAGVEYKFRIFAENRFGRSEPLMTSQMVAQWSLKAPSAPSAPEGFRRKLLIFLVTGLT